MDEYDLVDWMLDEFERIARKQSRNTDTLTESETLLYEVCLFDMEQQNGGVSQYFCNRGMEQWIKLRSIAGSKTESFKRFAPSVDDVIGHSDDPYEDVINSDIDLDTAYEQHRIQIISEVKALMTH